jgi:hypothetical protein
MVATTASFTIVGQGNNFPPWPKMEPFEKKEMM